MTRVLVVDDSALMRRVLGEILGAEPDIELAFARDGAEAIARVHDWAPDVVTLDVHMPGMGGLACLDRIMVERPCLVVMVAALGKADAELVFEAMALGAIDFVAKPEGPISLSMRRFGPELVERVRAAAQAKLRTTARLAERVRLRAAGGLRPPPSSRPATDQPGVAAGRPAGRWAEVGPLTAATRPTGRRMTAGQVVVIGASTGGPSALNALLCALPAGFPWPVLVAQHMPASFTGPMARRLDKLCALHVVEAAGPVPILPGTVHLGQGDADLVVAGRPGGPVVMAAPADPARHWHPSVDRLVDTAMQQIGAERLVGVLLTGMGNDGAAAMTRLREAGGRTIAEAAETAVVWGMPGELVRAGGAERVVRLEDIAGHLLAWAA